MGSLAESHRVYDRDAEAEDLRRVLQPDRRRFSVAPVDRGTGARVVGRLQAPWKDRTDVRRDVHMAPVHERSPDGNREGRYRCARDPSSISTLFGDDHGIRLLDPPWIDRQAACVSE